MTNPRDDLMALAAYHEANCSRYVNGRCTTLRCMRRGGHKTGEQFDWDNPPSTCEEHETAVALRTAASRPEVVQIQK